MATRINFIHRSPNSVGEFPTERRVVSLGGGAGVDPILISLEADPASANPADLLATIDSCHSPQDTANLLVTLLHGMAGEVADITADVTIYSKPEPAQTEETEPEGSTVLEGEVMDEEVDNA